MLSAAKVMTVNENPEVQNIAPEAAHAAQQAGQALIVDVAWSRP